VPAFSQCAKFFPILVKIIAHCLALPKRPPEKREAVSAVIGAAFEAHGLYALNVVQELLPLATERCYALLVGKRARPLCG
jgi:hypothetical protein